MIRKDSLDVHYRVLNKILISKNVLFLLIIVETILGVWFSTYLWFKILCIISVCSFFFINFLSELYNYILENKRIVNTVENGFDKFINSYIDTEGYYNNDLKKGLNKFNLNVFESVFFTKKIFYKFQDKNVILLSNKNVCF